MPELLHPFNHESDDCPRCQIGRMAETTTTYTRLFNGHVINVPSMTTFICDVCGFREYDYDMLTHLHDLLTDTGQPRAPKVRPTRPRTTVEPGDVTDVPNKAPTAKP